MREKGGRKEGSLMACSTAFPGDWNVRGRVQMKQERLHTEVSVIRGEHTKHTHSCKYRE